MILALEADNTDNYVIGVSPVDGSFGTAKLYGNEITFIRDVNDSSSVLSTKYEGLNIQEGNINIRNICIVDDIWITFFSGNIASYDPSSKSWDEHPNLRASIPGNYSSECLITKYGKLVIWSGNRFSILDEQWNSINLPETEIILDATQGSEDDVFWLLTKDRNWITKIIKIGDDGIRSEEAQYDFSWPGTSIYVSNKGELWLSTSDKIFKLKPERLSDIDEPVFELKEKYRYIRSIFEDNAGKIWVVTTEGLWVQKGKRLVQVDLPPCVFPSRAETIVYCRKSVGIVEDVAYDRQRNRLYLATEYGIFYADLDNLTE